MEKESLEVIEKESNKIEYENPKLVNRVLGNLIDLVLFALLFITLYIASNKITTSTPYYMEAQTLVDGYREDSGLYKYQSGRGTWELITTYYENNNDVDYPLRVVGCKQAIEDFHNFVLSYENEGRIQTGSYDDVVATYKECMLGVKKDDINLYVLDSSGTEIIKNPEATFDSTVYYSSFYRIYIEEKCSGFLSAKFPEYLSMTQRMSNCLFFIEIPSAFLVAAILVYYVPGLFFKRNRCTLGKLVYRIGLVDPNCLSVKFGRYTARSAIFIFGVLTLSLFTFGIPAIISFTMMLCTKYKQGFPDFMLKCVEIDCTKAKIYHTRYEASLNFRNISKKAIDFKPEHRE